MTLVGIYNEGNTCYFNSALQCIKSVAPNTKYSGECEFTTEYLRFQNDGSDVFRSEKLLVLFRNKYPRFDNKNQHDAQEAFLCILEILEKSLGMFLINGVIEHNVISRKGKTSNEEKFNIHIIFPSDTNKNIKTITENEIKWTPISTDIVSATQSIIKTKPSIMIYSLSVKSEITLVNILDNYTLFSTITHVGDQNSGHYINYIKNIDNGKWSMINDHMIIDDVDFPMTACHYFAIYKNE